MGAEFDDLAASQVNDHIGIPHRGNAMRDEQSGPSLHEPLQFPQDVFFSLYVYTGESVVENQNRRVFDDCSGESGSLFLAAGQTNSTLADDGLELMAEGFDGRQQLGNPRRFLGFLAIAAVQTEQNIVVDGSRKKKDVLRDEADGDLYFGNWYAFDIPTVDKNSPIGWLEKPEQQTNQSALAGTRLPHNSANTTWSDHEIDVLQHRGISSIREREITKFDRAPAQNRPHSRFDHFVTRRNRCIQNFKHPTQSRGASLVLIDNVADGHERPSQHSEIAVEGNELAEGHRTLQNLAASQPEHKGCRDSRQHLHQRPKNSP